MDGEIFYAPSVRLRSPEVDFGVFWWKGRPMYSGQHRISWIEDTGEVYAALLNRGRPAYRVIGCIPTREAVEQALEGWDEMCGGEASLAWAEDRVFVATVDGAREVLER